MRNKSVDKPCFNESANLYCYNAHAPFLAASHKRKRTSASRSGIIGKHSPPVPVGRISYCYLQDLYTGEANHGNYESA